MFDSVDPVHILLAVAVGAISLYSGGHALLNTRDSRSALVWLATCLAWPLLGPTVYWLFGRNRIVTKGRKLQRRFPQDPVGVRANQRSPEAPEGLPLNSAELIRVSENVTGRPLLEGNHVEALHCGEEAYPRMLAAIRSAKESVRLISYIFDNDKIGHEFCGALREATQRGVDVKVLLDGIGERHSLMRMSAVLEQAGVNAKRFLPPSLIPPSLHINLRNHRKILVVDGSVAFTGGMNISDRHFVDPPRRRRPVIDLHFAVKGPIVRQMEDVFLEDWAFVTGEDCDSTSSSPDPETGSTFCRAISDGPNEDIDKLKWILLGAISSAQTSIRIMTPYFIPNEELVSGLNAAALRGVRVEVVLPGELDIRPVGWAARNHLLSLLPFGVRVYRSPAPFVHTKLLIIDDHYMLIGSANLDPRSLRLNFEFNLELYGEECARSLIEHFETALESSEPITEQELANRSLLARLRDALAFLFSPYL